MPKKDHIEFDLDFLDKESPAAAPEANRQASSAASTLKESMSGNAWKIICGAIVVVLIIMWFGSSDGGGSTKVAGGSLSGNNDIVFIGDYECSQSHSRQAEALEPDEQDGSRIDALERSLKSRSAELEDMENEIETTYVDEYSQYEVDNYNELVDEYNDGLEELRQDLASFERRTRQYNDQVDEYNAYLESNCDST